MSQRLLIPVLLVVVGLLAACGGSDGASSSATSAAYRTLSSATDAFSAAGTAYVANLEACLNGADGQSAQLACAAQSLSTTAADWKPVGVALGALSALSDGQCKAQLEAAKEEAALLAGDGGKLVPTTGAEAEALPSELGQRLDALVQAVQDAQSVCVPS